MLTPQMFVALVAAKNGLMDKAAAAATDIKDKSAAPTPTVTRYRSSLHQEESSNMDG
jgi:hypothetical protein